jgi:perosamine synthetase
VIEDCGATRPRASTGGRKVGLDRRRDVLLALRDEEHRRGEGGLISTNRDDGRAGRASTCADAAAATARSTTSPFPGYKANLSDVLAAIALCQLDKVDKHREIRQRPVRAVRRGACGLDGITALARDERDVHALHLYIVRDRPRARRARRATSTSGAARGEHRDVIHFLPVHRLTYYRERFPEQPPLPIAERAGDEIHVAARSRRRHSDDDIGDADRAVARVHERFTT